MRKKWFFIAPFAVVGIIAFMALGGEVVRLLWNWLLPGLFGWRAITFWQGLGLLILCRILFGGLGRGHSRGWNRRNNWQKLTPEEREKIRERMRDRCGGFTSESSESKGTA
jgi:predicted Fe-S protein YdhL (DUF1289 family)